MLARRSLFALPTTLTRRYLNQPQYHLHAPSPLPSLLRSQSSTSAAATHLRPSQLQKLEEKDARRQRWIAKTQVAEKRRTRRAGRERRGSNQRQFFEWWNKRRDFMLICDSLAKKQGKKWKMKVAAVVERPELALPPLPDWEQDMHDIQSFLGQYGKQYPPPFADDDTVPKWNSMEEYLSQRPTRAKPTMNEADATTVRRKLDERLFLTVRGAPHKMGHSYWTLPTSPVLEGESLSDAGMRAVRAGVGKSLELYRLTEMPNAVEMKIYEEKHENQRELMEQGYYGEKLFFLVMEWVGGEVDVEECIFEDYAWLTKQEMIDRIIADRGQKTATFYKYML